MRSSNYYPPSNGVVERLHRTVKSRLDKLRADGLSCDDAIPWILRDIRGTPCSSTGKSPFFLLFGREMRGQYAKRNADKPVTGAQTNTAARYAQRSTLNKARELNFFRVHRF